MQRVLVLDRDKNPLMPCHPARARQMLKDGKAAIYRRYPFIIILKERSGGETQPVALKLDPGSKITGIALVADFQKGKRVIWAAELQHRSERIRELLLVRRAVRRSRRNRKTRYRKPRFLNRRRPEGWLPPSLKSRVDNILTWVIRLRKFSPISSLSQELVRFDAQKLENPEISGIEYQRGTLFGYEVKEYLLEKFGRQCAYCRGKSGDPILEVEHVVPKNPKHGPKGTDRVSNLVIACETCNKAKDNNQPEEWLARLEASADPLDKERAENFPTVIEQLKQPLKDTAAVNATRWAIFQSLKSFGLPVEIGTGGRTKYNRVIQHYRKAHWIDAACVGKSGESVFLSSVHVPLYIKAVGRGSRQFCRMDRHGFPRTSPKRIKRVHGFQTGDIVRATIPLGKYAGIHIGRIAVRASGSFRVGSTDGVSWRCCKILHCSDGYEY